VPAVPATAPSKPADAFLVRKAIVLFEEAIQKKGINTQCPMTVLQAIFDILVAIGSMKKEDITRQKEMLINVVTKVCAGVDGIAGTDDDLIPPSTVAMLRFILDNDLVGNVVKFIPPEAAKAAIQCASVAAKLLGLLPCIKKPATKTA
jgi:hypothetical protein